MAANIGLDAKVRELRNITGSAVGAWDKLVEIIDLLATSTKNPWGALALLDSTGALPVGFIGDYAGSAAPTGWLLCQGQSVSRTAYADLWNAIGSTYGSDSGTTFKVPDLRRRITMGAGGTKPVNSNGPGVAVGDTGGAEKIVLSAAQMPAHDHGTGTLAAAVAEGGSHSHSLGSNFWASMNGNPDNTPVRLDWSSRRSSNASSKSTLAAGAHTHSVTLSGRTASTGSASDVGVVQPAMALHKIIKT